MIKKRGNLGHVGYDHEELDLYSTLINHSLHGDKDLSEDLPLVAANHDIFEKLHNGIIYCKLLNLCKKGVIKRKQINFHKEHKPLNVYQINSNLSRAIAVAKSLGLKT